MRELILMACENLGRLAAKAELEAASLRLTETERERLRKLAHRYRMAQYGEIVKLQP